MPAQINLLDRRGVEARRRRRLAAGQWLLGGVLGALLLAGWRIHLQHRLDAGRQALAQTETVASPLADEAAAYTRLEQQRDSLRRHLDAIAALQAQRQFSVALLDLLARTPPDGVHLRAVRQRGGQLELEAIASDHDAIAEYLARLAASPLLHAVRLALIRDQDAAAPAFTVQAQIGDAP